MSYSLILKSRPIELAMERTALIATLAGAVALSALVVELTTSGTVSTIASLAHEIATVIFAFDIGVAYAYREVMQKGTK